MTSITLTLGMITTDTADAVALGTWWADRLGGTVADPYGGEFVLVSGPGLPVMLAFQKVPQPTSGKNRLHLDLTSTDLDGCVDGFVAAGATLIERRGQGGFHWVTLADPDGNEFCVASAQEMQASFSG